MVDIVLIEPEIPNNSGAIAPTMPCTGARLHLNKAARLDISGQRGGESAQAWTTGTWWTSGVRQPGRSISRFNGRRTSGLRRRRRPQGYVDCDWRGDVTLMFRKRPRACPNGCRKLRENCLHPHDLPRRGASTSQTRLPY